MEKPEFRRGGELETTEERREQGSKKSMRKKKNVENK